METVTVVTPSILGSQLNKTKSLLLSLGLAGSKVCYVFVL